MQVHVCVDRTVVWLSLWAAQWTGNCYTTSAQLAYRRSRRNRKIHLEHTRLATNTVVCSVCINEACLQCVCMYVYVAYVCVCVCVNFA